MSIKLEFINLGRIKNIYKHNGDLTCKLNKFRNDLLFFNREAWIKLEDDEFLPVIIEKIYRLNSQSLVKFKNINSADEAKIYQQSELFFKCEILEKSDDNKKCIGYSVFNNQNQLMGKVVQILEIPGNLLLLIEMDNKDVMLPIVDEFIQLFDNENEKIIIKNYKELLEL